MRTVRASIEPQLRLFIKAAAKPENQDLAHHIAITARNMIRKAASEYEFHTPPVAVATAAAKMNLDSVDRQLTAHIAQATGRIVKFAKPDMKHRAVVQHVRVPVGDATIIQFPPAGSQQQMQNTVRQHIANNVQLIHSIPQQYFARLEDDIYDNVINAQRWETLADTLTNTVDYDGMITQSRADLIARDQTSKMNGAFNQDRQESVGVTQYRWQTSEDDRVRPTHADNDQQIFDWDDPPEETGHPGQDINCRCVALAMFEELEEAA